jgi:hypothetical protein
LAQTASGDDPALPACRCVPSYTAWALAYAPDLIATVLLLAGASIGAGRVWRFPFDDELYSLTVIERYSVHTLLTVFPTVEDVHPPLSYLVFYGLRQLGASEPGMRLASLAMTALALVLFQLLALNWIAERNRGIVSLPSRLLAVLLFGLAPLAIGQGDALRWYPLFALLFALSITLYLVGNRTAQLCSGIALGLAASTNLMAALFIPAFMLYRYGLQRRFRWSFDPAYWTLAACGAGLGLYTAYWVLARRLAIAHSDFGTSIVQAALINALGFFGGDALGVSQAWLVVPVVVIAAVAVFSVIDRQEPGKPVHLLLLMLGVPALMTLFRFGEPRAFLYLVPVVAAVLTLFFDRQVRLGHAGRVVALIALVLVASISAIANVNFATHPFKRNAAVPYQGILDFIDSNAKGSALVVSTDPVLVRALQQSGGDRCVGYYFGAKECLAAGRRYDSIFIVSGHSDKSGNATMMAKFNAFLSDVTAGRNKVVTFGAGLDEDAALKSRLTGVPLEKYILTVDLYR